MIQELIKKSPKKYLIFLLVIELLFLSYSVNSLYQNYGTTKTFEFSAWDFSNRMGELKGNSFYVDDSYIFDTEGNLLPSGLKTFTYGPYAVLTKGSYTITLHYNTDTDGNQCYPFSNMLSSSQLKSAYRIPLSKEKNSVTFDLLLEQNTKDLEIITEYNGTGNLRIDKMTITKTPVFYIRNIFTTFAGCLIVLVIYYFYVSNKEKRKTILALTLIILSASYPLFTDYITAGHDLPFHLNRIEGLAQGLQSGIFPVKIHPFWINDYGYAVGVFYGDAFLYLPAFLYLAGFTLTESYKVYVFLINLATVLFSWKCFERIFKSNNFGILAAFLYTLAPYRLSNMYLRASVGEYTALTFLPIVLYGFYRIFTEDYTQKNYWKNFLLPALGLTGIIQCHIISCEMVGIFIIIICLIMLNRICKLRVFLTLCLAAFTTLLLNLGFLIPFLNYFGGDFVMNSENFNSVPIQASGAYIPQLFAIFNNGVGSSSSTASGMAGEMPLGIGFALFLGLLLFFYIRFCDSKTKETGIFHNFINLSALLTVLALFMSTNSFPWNTIANISELVKKLVHNMQFPWRFLTITTLFSVIITAYALQLTRKYYSRETFIRMLSIITCFLVISTSWFYYEILNENIPLRYFNSTDLNSMLIGSEEYLPEDTNISELPDGVPLPGEGVEIQSFTKNGTTIRLQVTSHASDSHVDLPLLYYDGYVATSDTTSLSLQRGKNNVIRLDIPANFNGIVTIAFREPLSWRIGELISAITALGIIIGLLVTVPSKAKQKYNHPVD